MFNSVISKLNFTVIRDNSYKTTYRKCFMPTQLLAEYISRARHDFLLVLKEPFCYTVLSNAAHIPNMNGGIRALTFEFCCAPYCQFKSKHEPTL